MTAEEALTWARQQMLLAAERDEMEVVLVYQKKIIPGLVRVCFLRQEHTG